MIPTDLFSILFTQFFSLMAGIILNIVGALISEFFNSAFGIQ